MAKKVVVIRVGTKTTHIVHMEDAKTNPTIYGVRAHTNTGKLFSGWYDHGYR